MRVLAKTVVSCEYFSGEDPDREIAVEEGHVPGDGFNHGVSPRKGCAAAAGLSPLERGRSAPP